jgi:hypothetical protein
MLMQEGRVVAYSSR